MVRLIDRYIVREFGPFFVIALGVTTFVLFLDKLLGLGSFMLRNHLDAWTFLRFLGFMLPTVSGLALPIALLLGSILTFNRLSTDSEYIALKAAGISFYRLLLPLFVAASVVYGASSFALMYGSPWGLQGLRRLIFEVARSQAYYYLRPREFNDTFAGLVLYVERLRPEGRQLEGVFMADTRVAPPQVITARHGELLTRADTWQVLLRLEEGTIHRYIPAQKRYHLLRFRSYDVRLDLDAPMARGFKRELRPREFFPAQLQQEIRRRQAAGEEFRPLVLFWHTLFALPFACVIFAGLGPALGVVETRSGRSGGYVLGLLAIFVYYILLTVGNTLGEKAPLPPVLAAWLPNLCMGLGTALLLRRTARAGTRLGISAGFGLALHPWQRWRSRFGNQLTTRG
jgi:lipopolysaccharide export system permease protein